MEKTPSKVALIILDGWGIAPDSSSNAISQSSTPVWDNLLATQPHTTLDASENHVGLPQHQMGNSEVGHMTIGGGRIFQQDLDRINDAIKTNALSTKPQFLRFLKSMKEDGGFCHMMGLFSSGGIHSHKDHLLALLSTISENKIPIWLHLFLDGRDTTPQSALGYIKDLQKNLPSNANIATLSGRYYGMDRDNRWDRIAKSYDAITRGHGTLISDPLEYIHQCYNEKITDEFIPPAVLKGYSGIQEKDGLLCFNFRSDRVRQILTSLLDKTFNKFTTSDNKPFDKALGMTSYGKALDPYISPLLEEQKVENSLGEVIAQVGKKQFRLAETEKYAHVTFFLNGGRDEPFAGEERHLVPSPKVATYDIQPQMAAPEVTDVLIKTMEQERYDLIIVNYANADMVGHTGNMNAAIKAVESIDSCLGLAITAAQQHGYTVLITADHGNVEKMVNDKTNKPHTAHTCNKVPLIYVTKNSKKIHLKTGTLADIAPTILDILDITQPDEMTGKTLLT